MIRSPTVFVVGAGASTDFGLPVGAKLKEAVAEATEFKSDGLRGVMSGPFASIYATLRYAAQQSDGLVKGEKVQAYVSAAAEIRRAMPLALSIDNYLDAHQTSQPIVAVGKMAVAQSILSAEADSSLTDPDPSNIYNEFDFERNANTWINAFFRKVAEGVAKGEIETLFSNVSIVTFNYDRCIEQFLYYAIQRYYQVDAKQAASVLASLRLVHVYGSVGRLAWQSGSGAVIGYGDTRASIPLTITDQLFTFTETHADEERSRTMKAIFDKAEQIVFLGFSFLEQNVRVLPPALGNLTIVGTARGMSKTNLDVVESLLRTHFAGSPPASIHTLTLDSDMEAASFIDNYWRVIR